MLTNSGNRGELAPLQRLGRTPSAPRTPNPHRPPLDPAHNVCSFSARNAQAAIRVVNAEEKNPAACAIMNVAYMRGEQVGMARHGENAFGIVRILVVGVVTGNGILPVRPAAHFSLFGVKEYAI